MDTIFLWIGTHFTDEVYLFSTKIQGIIWSIADIILIYFVLKITGFARAKEQKKRILFRYLLLWFSAILTPLLIFTKTRNKFFYLESIICGIQFSILVYTVISDRKNMMSLIKGILVDKNPKSP